LNFPVTRTLHAVNPVNSWASVRNVVRLNWLLVNKKVVAQELLLTVLNLPQCQMILSALKKDFVKEVVAFLTVKHLESKVACAISVSIVVMF